MVGSMKRQPTMSQIETSETFKGCIPEINYSNTMQHFNDKKNDVSIFNLSVAIKP